MELEESSTESKKSRGLVLVITGNGKGKSTAGFGVVSRSVGHGYKAAVAQFIKGKWDCGERNLLVHHDVPFSVMATGFTWESKDKIADMAAAEKVWNEAKEYLTNPSYYVVLLDELTYMLSLKYLDTKDVLDTIRNRPVEQTVIITGRDALPELIELADTVSEIKDVKHAFQKGIIARKGIDW
ncbi:cob(I)yrinic acid a,c-diamide adenosyltransferase [Oceanispirochaeta crateris]|uniref:corrinoid adenosyltransferase n=1 Tax=Oceanispirochaeta crateris TaxID=2518645 RepID=A0A5C1QLU2_9SPIO|nr:cob(I)yrinic acid a,c-diamide adenosyltransferase [Oceanispirochaeta crateris]QEN08298.1 cob(I)yrinic acid a,c-diamide adenosyltransferase [Oceanispirochaeta crateris]